MGSFRVRISGYLFRLKFNSRVYSAVSKIVPLICLGDSHANVFRYIRENNLLRNIFIDVVVVGGATAQGMINPNSKTDALAIFRQRILKAKKHQAIVIQLGEVDCGFVIWYYAEKYLITVQEQLSRSLNNYAAFLEELKGRGFSKIIVMSAPLPSVKDDADWGETENARKDVKASQKERTALTIKYNQALKEICKKNNIYFLDTTEFLIDHNTGVVKEHFLYSDKLDFHLHRPNYAALVCKLFNTNVFAYLFN